MSPMAPSTGSTRVARSRLDAVLRSGARLIVVRGVRGAGKTSLLHRWATWFDGAAWRPDLQEPPEQELLLVDDADDLTPRAWQIVERLLDDRPATRIVVAVRSARSVPARLEMDVVADLPLTSAEIGWYVARRGSQADPRAVLRATAGLPDLVQRVAQSGVVAPSGIRRIVAESPAVPLAAEDALAAVPSVLTPGLVRWLGLRDDLLDDLECEGVGWWIGCPTGGMFRLRPDVRAATLLLAEATGVDVARLREGAAAVLLDEGSWAAAIAEGCDIGRYELVEMALLGGGVAMLRERADDLLAALYDVAPGRLVDAPTVALALGMLFNVRRTWRLHALDLFATAVAGARAVASRVPDLRIAMLAVESAALRLSDGEDGGVSAAREAIALLQERTAEPHALVADAYVQCGLSLLAGADGAEARYAFERALQRSPRPLVSLLAHGGLAASFAVDGDLPAARMWLAEAEWRSWPEALLNGTAATLLRAAQALVAVEQGDIEAADIALEAARDSLDTSEHWALLLGVEALRDIVATDAVVGLQRFFAVRGRHEGESPSRATTAILTYAETILALAAGEHDIARRVLTVPVQHPVQRLAAARVALHSGDGELAMRLLGGLEPATPLERVTVAALNATVVALDGGQDPHPAVSRARAIADAYGLTTPFLLLPRVGRELFESAAITAPAAPVDARGAFVRLTPREHVLLRELLETTSSEELSRRLFVSVNTVKSQRRSLYRKLGVRTRREALTAAMAHGLFDATPDAIVAAPQSDAPDRGTAS